MQAIIPKQVSAHFVLYNSQKHIVQEKRIIRLRFPLLLHDFQYRPQLPAQRCSQRRICNGLPGKAQIFFRVNSASVSSGVMISPPMAPGWGYGNRISEEELIERFEHMVTAIEQLPYICGYCYTQLTDVQQEINGLMDMQRNFKVDPKQICNINLR